MTCSRSVQKVLCACALAGLSVWSAPPAGADIIPVNLTLDPPAAPVNTLDVSITVDTIVGRSATDTGTTTASGNVLAELHATFDPGTHVGTVTGLEFTGGAMAFTDMSFLLDFGSSSTVSATSSNVQATSDTPAPPGSVAGTTFSALEHRVIFNAGTVAFTPSGPIAAYVPPFTYSFSTNPLAVAKDLPGTLTVSAPSIVGLNVTYDVFLSMPLDFSRTMFQDPNAGVGLSGMGTLQASGQFVRVIPEPASAVLLVLGWAAALVRRRRR